MTATFRPDLFLGKTALVAGGTSGINLGIAVGLKALGARVAVLGRDPDRAAAAAIQLGGDPNALAVSCDVREPEQLEAAFKMVAENFGPIDILVSGAAGNFFAPVKAMSPRGFRTVVDIDLIGTFNVFRLSYPYLRPGEASLIAISAPQSPRPMQAHAAAAKAGINQFVRVLAMEWGREGFRINAVSPGPIAGTKGLSLMGEDPAQLDRFLNTLALPKLGTVQDIADAVTFLCSPAARFITGTVLDCDGGLGLGDSSGGGRAATER